RRVVRAEDQHGVGLAALQRDPHGHLVNGAAGQAVGPAQRLRTEQNVQAKRAALAHQAVEQASRVLGQTAGLDEKLLEFVHNEQHARQRSGGFGLAERSHVLRTRLAETVAATLQFRIKTLQYAQTKLALALDGDDAGVRQFVSGVGLELHAFL